ncbi:MAG: pilus assembly protein PilC [Candidatus Omnitrophica bacterium CG11_big_fil_rev_8_21_14_0_20_42_13]|uniref:General secretion pathway protein F n=1 Tax=Candidatus Ghiorseimicrobium undicola TaxID=1974746 RepID=A0A2H0LXA2_9BACT|nr:MAG: pilus assembly protein PilC [Candidatus Omnitrophica bacterium CG11_big_fil_rev_8_21_14_0_20_42_13]
MPNYKYVAKDKTGKNVSGLAEMPDEVSLIDRLHRQELLVVSIHQTKAPKLQARSVKLDELVIFCRQLATMIDSGIPLAQTLSILAEQTEDKYLSEVTAKTRQDIEEGLSFSEALKKHQKVFSGLFISMVRAGEVSGQLDEVLDRLATYLEKVSVLKRKVRSSLIYPVVVISMAILITTFLLIKVVPTFKAIFVTLGGRLPLPTRILIGISDGIRSSFLYIVIILVILGIIIQRYVSTEKGRYNFDKMLLKVPIFGQLFRKVAVAKFSRTLSTLVKSGVPIIDSLEIVGKTSGNKIIEQAIIQATSSIKEGEPIAEPLARGNIFPPMVVRMISVGEQTGHLEKMLSKIADFYEEQVDAAVSALTSLIEPVVIVLLGTIIGGIVISLFLPIFSVLELIGH